MSPSAIRQNFLGFCEFSPNDYFVIIVQRFKEMREMHGSSSRDDRQKREQLREEKEMAKFAQMYTNEFCK